MIELYWLTRLDAICDILSIVIALSIICTVICPIVMWTHCDYRDDKYKDSSYNADNYWIYHFTKDLLKKASITLIICSALSIFIPTTKDAYIIYGIGGTIDYLKTNDKAKHLPDKVINALDKYLDDNENEDK